MWPYGHASLLRGVCKKIVKQKNIKILAVPISYYNNIGMSYNKTAIIL